MRATAPLFLAAIVLLAVLGVGCGTSGEEGTPQPKPTTSVQGEGASPETAGTVEKGTPQPKPTTPGQGEGASPEIGGTAMGIDANPSAAPANTATSLGSIETCISVTSGAAFDVDVFVDRIPDGRDLAGFNYFLKFDSSKLQINRTDYNMLLASQPRSNVLDAGERTMPDTDGSLGVVAADITGAASAEPAGSRGVLARYQLQAVGSGTSRLSLEPTPTYLTDSTAQGYDPGQVLEATIAIDEPCP